MTLVFLSAVLSFAFDDKPLQGSLHWYAAKAKTEGKTDLTLATPNGIPVSLNTLQQALAEYMVVVATPIATTVNSPDGYHIWTWYKLQLTDILKEHRRPEEPDFTPTPDALKPVGRNEFVTHIEGGILHIDGVELNQPYSPTPPFTLGERYLLFILPTSSNHSGSLQAGKNAVFHISPADQLEPVSSTSTAFHKDVLTKSGKSLTTLKQICAIQ